jgi:hypothetical protein
MQSQDRGHEIEKPAPAIARSCGIISFLAHTRVSGRNIHPYTRQSSLFTHQPRLARLKATLSTPHYHKKLSSTAKPTRDPSVDPPHLLSPRRNLHPARARTHSLNMSFLNDLLNACLSCLRRLQPNTAQPGRRTHALFRYDINMPRLEPARPIFNSSGPNSDGSSYRLNMSSSLFPPFAELPLRESMSSFAPNRKRKDARTHTRANNNAASNRTRYFLGTVGMVFLSSASWLHERLIRLLFADQEIPWIRPMYQVRDKTGKKLLLAFHVTHPRKKENAQQLLYQPGTLVSIRNAAQHRFADGQEGLRIEDEQFENVEVCFARLAPWYLANVFPSCDYT